MEKYVYLKKKHSTHFVEFDEELSSELYDNLGTTWEDYEDNKWVLLTSEQLAFYEEHPTATPSEVFNLEIVVGDGPTEEMLLQQAKVLMLMRLKEWDESENVNGFDIVIDGQTITTWIDRETRADYKNSLDAAEMLEQTEVTPVFNGQAITIPLSTAKMALAQIQLYANRCYNVTEQKKAAIMAFEAVEDVENFDIVEGYPEKLVFELPVANNNEEQERGYLC